ncbi:MAG: response regulator transcription factor [Pseudonocardia sp.]|nr:response regulator transcription factor [Pseudonocardia sp.]
MSTPRRVLIGDDEALVRAGIRAVLGADPGIEVVAEASDGRAVVTAALAHRPDVVLLDLNMPAHDGFGALDELSRVLPSSRVLVLTTFGDDDSIRRALSAGAAGFVLKASDPRELIGAVHAVGDGAAFLSPRVTQRVLARFRDAVSAPAVDERIAVLTCRERDVLALLARGLPNSDIGRRLFLTEGTVKGHVTAIMGKLGVANRVQAALIGHDAGLTR